MMWNGHLARFNTGWKPALHRRLISKAETLEYFSQAASPMINTGYKIILQICYLLLPPAMCLLAIAALVAQFYEISANKQEIIPITSLITLLSLSALAFNWCRVPGLFSSEDALKRVYEAGVDLFISTIMAFVSLVVAFILQTFQQQLNSIAALLLLIAHWLFFSLALLIFVFSTIALIAAAKQSKV